MEMTNKAIYFDLDGTLADLYAVDGWLPMLRAYDPTPYAEAEVLVNMNSLAKILHRLQREGWHIGIVSWLSKTSTAEYDEAVIEAKKRWLSRHLRSVQFDEMRFLPYGMPKQENVDFPYGVLFDDENGNREAWTGEAFDVNQILETLKSLL